MTSRFSRSVRPFSQGCGRNLLAVAFVCAVVACGSSRGEADSDGRFGSPGWLGLAIDDSLVPGRLVVVEIDAGGPAATSGVRLQDSVLAINGEPTLDADRFAAVIATISPGDTVRFSVERGGVVEEVSLVAAEATRPAAAPAPETPALGRTAEGGSSGPVAGEPAPLPQSFFGRPPSSSFSSADSASPAVSPPAVSLPAFPEQRPAPNPWQGSTAGAGTAADSRNFAEGPATREGPAGHESGRSKTALGVKTVPVDSVVQTRYSLPEPAGALVVGLIDDLPASRAGLPTGSVIVAFDRQPVRSPSELTRLVSTGPIDRPVKLEYILPGGEAKAADVSLVSVAKKADEPASYSGNPGVSADADREALRMEIFQMRKAIDALVRRLEDLERRSAAGGR